VPSVRSWPAISAPHCSDTTFSAQSRKDDGLHNEFQRHITVSRDTAKYYGCKLYSVHLKMHKDGYCILSATIIVTNIQSVQRRQWLMNESIEWLRYESIACTQQLKAIPAYLLPGNVSENKGKKLKYTSVSLVCEGSPEEKYSRREKNFKEQVRFKPEVRVKI